MTVELSSAVFSSDIAKFQKNGDKNSIVELVRQRFQERFFEPFKSNEAKHGFSMMAVSCLMIEALLSMQQGLNKSTDAKRADKSTKSGTELFSEFFSSSKYLTDFAMLGDEFYPHIRNGILHQAETTGGWRIRRSGNIVCSETKIINATKFMKALESELEHYLVTLKNKELSDPLWVNLMKKIGFIAENAVAQ
ncbi:hypothetical protein HWQ46_01780 [Shewanella sp. D64]|uniref:hypothetical protein n=1 Tax=unclassified Shewanella TaxID=196818 RepID=UPI0022BA437A|nr:MULTISPECIES: hypothetical protein [unclassified Shewanella]MEC4724277.1 hypothetical protein [Shewanella sp. D64]MEC4738789.1 hypothetical protein [Shewanella sp. E94]WBJ97771.1 hypothetical protein HWQ47_12075 [Shewanella sp. MTB7]